MSPNTSDGLGGLFDATWQSPTTSALNELRLTCTAFVQRLRADGHPPERVLVALKREITVAGAMHQAPSTWLSCLGKDELRRARMYDKVFRWFLDDYFDL